MVEPNHTLNQRREDRDQLTAQNAVELWKPALRFQADLIILWANGAQMMAQTIINFAEKMKQN